MSIYNKSISEPKGENESILLKPITVTPSIFIQLVINTLQQPRPTLRPSLGRGESRKENCRERTSISIRMMFVLFLFLAQASTALAFMPLWRMKK